MLAGKMRSGVVDPKANLTHFANVAVGDKFILLPAVRDAPLLLKTSAHEAVYIFNGLSVTNITVTQEVQKIKM